MSRNAMIALRAALADDPALQARLTAAPTNVEFVGLAAAAGFAITLDDLALLAEDVSDAEVSDAELEGITGGGASSVECRPMYPKTWNYCDW